MQGVDTSLPREWHLLKSKEGQRQNLMTRNDNPNRQIPFYAGFLWGKE